MRFVSWGRCIAVPGPTTWQRRARQGETPCAICVQSLTPRYKHSSRERPGRDTRRVKPRKSDNLTMWNMGGGVQQICQWILATNKEDGFSSLREILSMIAFSDSSVLRT